MSFAVVGTLLAAGAAIPIIGLFGTKTAGYTGMAVTLILPVIPMTFFSILFFRISGCKMGANSMIGAHCYIAPGVTIGKNCVIGLNSYIRQGKTIPDNTKLTSVGAVSFSTAGRLEKE